MTYGKRYLRETHVYTSNGSGRAEPDMKGAEVCVFGGKKVLTISTGVGGRDGSARVALVGTPGRDSSVCDPVTGPLGMVLVGKNGI